MDVAANNSITSAGRGVMSGQRMNVGKVLDTCTYAVSCTGIAATVAKSLDWIQQNSGAIMAIIAFVTFCASQYWQYKEHKREKAESEMRMLEIKSRLEVEIKQLEGE